MGLVKLREELADDESLAGDVKGHLRSLLSCAFVPSPRAWFWLDLEPQDTFSKGSIGGVYRDISSGTRSRTYNL
jgi:hypothetical protein